MQLIQELLQIQANKQVQSISYERENDAWDQQMQADAATGKFDELAAIALAEYRAGKTVPL